MQAAVDDYVDGTPNHHPMLQLALDRNPTMPYRLGEYNVVATWHHRQFDCGGVLRRAPTAAETEAIEERIRGSRFRP